MIGRFDVSHCYKKDYSVRAVGRCTNHAGLRGPRFS
jgi:hypothetical protein